MVCFINPRPSHSHQLRQKLSSSDDDTDGVAPPLNVKHYTRKRNYDSDQIPSDDDKGNVAAPAMKINCDYEEQNLFLNEKSNKMEVAEETVLAQLEKMHISSSSDKEQKFCFGGNKCGCVLRKLFLSNAEQTMMNYPDLLHEFILFKRKVKDDQTRVSLDRFKDDQALVSWKSREETIASLFQQKMQISTKEDDNELKNSTPNSNIATGSASISKEMKQ